tara:strand:+ start:9260 stop:10336 length:1077 start_codon:yes stop_codon:yes gene_type:complete
MVKNKIFQYFFKEFFKLFLIISLSFSLLIWFTQAARLLELITEFGNPIQTYMKYLLFNYPKILDNTLLLSFIITLFFLYTKLQNEKEIDIYWLSGVSKITMYKISLLIGLIVLIFNIVLSNFLAPWSSYQGRMVLGKSKFTLLNALVKEKNFNSPLSGLTIYVESNDQKGNLKGIFIYDKLRSITAQTGKVLSDGNNSFLELYNGTTQEIAGNKINFINFNSTVFDFSKYQLKHTSYPKFNERNFNWLIKNLSNKSIPNERKQEIREEINSRILKPFLIIIITCLISFSLYSNDEKFNLKKLKIFIYILSIALLILNQILLGISGKNLNYTFGYAFFLIIFFLSINFLFIKFIKSESQ